MIATACEEQANVAREVDKNLVNIQDLSTQTAAGAHQTTASAQELSRLRPGRPLPPLIGVTLNRAPAASSVVPCRRLASECFQRA